MIGFQKFERNLKAADTEKTVIKINNNIVLFQSI